MSQPQKTYVNGSCHCESNVFRVEFDRASLPIKDDLCHCNTCRHSTGQMAVHHTAIVGTPLAYIHEDGSRGMSENGKDEEGGGLRINLDSATSPGGLLSPPTIEISYPMEPFNLGELTAYKSSHVATRYFCSSCSAHLFWVRHDGGEEGAGFHWAVAVGSLARVARISRIAYHIWVGDTLDGGLADHLRSVDGVQLRRYGEGMKSVELPYAWKDGGLMTSARAPASSTDTLKGYCHCGAVKFAITRPSEASVDPTSPYPDLLHSHLYSHLSKISNPKDEKWWLRPANSSSPTKYLAGHCVCNVCRLNSGFEIQSWAFIPLANIVQGDSNEPLILEDGGSRPRKLKQYITSTGNYREFCGTCGATAFSWQAAVPDLISVSFGLFDERDHGARAEDWFEWHTERVSFQESALDPALAKGLQDGLKGNYN